MSPCFQNVAGHLSEESAGFLRVSWSNQARRLEDTRAMFMHMLQVLRLRGWSRILIDQINMWPFTAEEQVWVAREWVPQAVRGGYRHGAVVVSPNVMVRLSTAYITTHAQRLALVYRSFEAEADALEWLLQQPASPQ